MSTKGPGFGTGDLGGGARVSSTIRKKYTKDVSACRSLQKKAHASTLTQGEKRIGFSVVGEAQIAQRFFRQRMDLTRRRDRRRPELFH